MAVRASSKDVINIMEFNPSIEDISPFIDAANELVTEICDPAKTGYTAKRLKLIETWLAAHFLAIRDPRYTSETTGPASASMAMGQLGMNLSSTSYGQQALLFDTKGGLAWLDKHISQGKRQRAGIVWLGTTLREKMQNRSWLYSDLFLS